MPQTFNVGARSLFVTTVACVHRAVAAGGGLGGGAERAVASLLPGWRSHGAARCR